MRNRSSRLPATRGRLPSAARLSDVVPNVTTTSTPSGADAQRAIVFESMTLDEAEAVFFEIPTEQREVLRLAHLRFLRFAGICRDKEFRKQVAADRALFPHYRATEAGEAALQDDHIAGFMSEICGLPREWCLAADRIDFVFAYGIKRAREVFG